jgi:hypothetical protein
MTDDLKASCRGQIRYYSGVCLKGQRETAKNLSTDNRFPGRDSSQVPPELKTRMLSVALFVVHEMYSPIPR